MSLRVTRLTHAEWLLGAGSILLLVDLFGVSWFAYEPRFHLTAAMLGQRASANGWETFDVIGPLALVVCCAGISVAWLTASRRSPAMPTVVATLLAPLSFVLALLVAIRVLIDRPAVHLVQAGGANVIQVRPGAYLGLALSIAVFVGTYLTLRRDSIAQEDAPTVIQTLSVGESRTESPA